MGHRVVHGMHLDRPLEVTDSVLADIRRAAIFAPLHNPANAEGITAAQAVFGESTPQACTEAMARVIDQYELNCPFSASACTHTRLSSSSGT